MFKFRVWSRSYCHLAPPNRPHTTNQGSERLSDLASGASDPRLVEVGFLFNIVGPVDYSTHELYYIAAVVPCTYTYLFSCVISKRN
jgi:hypothetical protein